MKCPATHRMPDGSIMTGKTHSAKSVVPSAKCMPKSMMIAVPKMGIRRPK